MFAHMLCETEEIINNLLLGTRDESNESLERATGASSISNPLGCFRNTTRDLHRRCSR